MRYCLICDDDGHYFAVPTMRQAEFSIWLSLVQNARVTYRLPDYAIPIDNPNLLTFTDPKTE